MSLSLSVQITEQTLVTASKTGEEDLQKTPLAVVSFIERARHAAGSYRGASGRPGAVGDVLAEYRLLPAHHSRNRHECRVRGIDPSSAVYVDGVYLARPAMVLADFQEVDRVEVLRGPQGTLYGRNAVGGRSTSLPRSQPTGSKPLRTALGNLDTLRIEGRVSGPLLREQVLGSASFLRGIVRGLCRTWNTSIIHWEEKT